MVSAEVARKQIFAPRLVHGRNVLIVGDPRDHDELAAVLRDALNEGPGLQALGIRGERLLPESVAATDQIRSYEELFEAAIDKTPVAVEHSRDGTRDDECRDEEQLSWAALQKPHPAIACTEVLDDLFYRHLDTIAPDPTLIPALAPNVVIRPFSRHMDTDGESSPCAYAFQHLPFRDRTRVVRLGLGHNLLSSFVNGERSLGAIATCIDPDDDSMLQSVCAAARDLFDEGIITFTTRKEPTWPSSLTTKQDPTPQ